MASLPRRRSPWSKVGQGGLWHSSQLQGEGTGRGHGELSLWPSVIMLPAILHASTKLLQFALIGFGRQFANF
eukprot:5248678-Pleurochrysis_carterae.AAC.1